MAPIVKRKTIFSLYTANSWHSRSTHSRCGLVTISTSFPAARSFRSTATHSSRNRGVMSWLVGDMTRPLYFFRVLVTSSGRNRGVPQSSSEVMRPNRLAISAA